jgi:CHAT domain-containing protein/tetratricopeptide (TPR) repeat protein
MRRFVFLAVACLALAAPLRAQNSSGTAGPPQSEATFLEPAKPLERALQGGEKHIYAIRADTGQFLHAIVEQLGIHVALTLNASDGKALGSMDSPNGKFGLEQISTIVEAPGIYRLEVASGDKNAPAGRYRVTVEPLRAPGDQDRARLTAERMLFEAVTVQRQEQGSADSKRIAIQKYLASLPGWRTAGDRYEEALTQESIGVIYSSLGEKQKALDYLNQALPLMRAVEDRASEATTLDNIGSVYSALGEMQKALDYFNQALPLRRAVGDRAGEASTLTGIGAVYARLTEERKALDYFNRALPLRRAVGDRRGEAETLNNIGFVYSHLGEKQKALDYFNQALPLERAVGNRAAEAATLSSIGGVYDDFGEKPKALDYYNQALPLRRAVGDRAGEAITLNNIGLVYHALGENQNAVDYYNQALALERAVGNRADEAATLSNVGMIYDDLGEKQKALDYYNQALPLQRAVGDRAGEATTLQNIGVAYAALGEKQKALDYYNQALPIERAVGDRGVEATTLYNVGAIYNALGENQKALDYFNQALPLRRAVGDRAGEATTLGYIGVVYSALGEKQKALDYYTQSLPLSRAVQDPLGEGYTLVDLMEYWKSLQNPSLAVLFGKQAIDRFQQVRRNIAGLGKGAQRSFLKSKEDYYRELAELLISGGRLPEAQQVLDLLKIEEYSEYAEHRGSTDSSVQPMTYNTTEAKSKKDGDDIENEITALGQEWSTLHAKASLTPEEVDRYKYLSEKMIDTGQRMQKYLNDLSENFGKSESDASTDRTLNEIAESNQRLRKAKGETSDLQTLVADLGPGTVALYTLVLPEKYVVIVITPEVMVKREVLIGSLTLRTKVIDFKMLASKETAPEDEVKEKGKDLYQILVAPIEKDLAGAHAQTLMWSLDDALLYVPIAALYDGKQYLVERYRNVVTTPNRSQLRDQPQLTGLTGLAMGVSKVYNPEDKLGPLQAVPGELQAVVQSGDVPDSHGPLQGTIMLNDAFTEKNMEEALKKHSLVVHIASHYIFSPGNDSTSYLLLGGKDVGGAGYHMTLAEVRYDPRVDFHGAELLTLSGCETALGANDANGHEIDGLGMVAQEKGAKAVIATLWKVDDASVGLLMATFYKLWVTTPGITKAEALQQAQLALLHGTAVPAGTPQVSAAAASPASASKQPSASQYANPYYWAPFILIGNWK